MKFEQEPQPRPPSGEAGKLQESARENWQERLLLFSQVKNKVLEVNPDVYIPLKLEEGKPSPLGLFVEASFQEKPEKLPKGKQALEVLPGHSRSAILGRVIFGDKEGRIYRDIDLKGIGEVAFEFELPYRPEDSRRKEAKAGAGKLGEVFIFGRWGLLDRDTALFDRQLSEEFLNAGIRTNRVLSIIELQELIVAGKKISLDEAVKLKIIDRDFHPVVAVRAFGTRARIEDLEQPGSLGYYKGDLLLEDAKKLVSQELGRKEIISNKEYVEWFSKTLGHNMALMHKNGWLHNYIGSHNLTLDCRIVDLDSVAQLSGEKARQKEIKTTKDVIDSLINIIPGIIREPDDYAKIFKIFNESYEAVFHEKESQRHFKKIKGEQPQKRTPTT